MKTKIVTSLLLLFSVIFCMNAQQTKPNIVGTWKLVSYKYGEMPSQLVPDSLQKVKIITRNSFTWVEYQTKSKNITSSGGGTYVLKGRSYIENLVFGLGMGDFLGKNQTFTVKVKNGKMIQSGRLSNDYKIEEVWRRVKSL